MGIVTTDIQVLALVPTYDPDGFTLTGLELRYKLSVEHGGNPATDLTHAADVWSALSGGEQSSVQNTFDAAKAKLV